MPKIIRKKINLRRNMLYLYAMRFMGPKQGSTIYPRLKMISTT